MPSPLQKLPNGTVTWTSTPGDSYLVTGKTRAGKRFRFATEHWAVARAVNVWRGSYWLIRDNQRFLIQSRYN